MEAPDAVVCPWGLPPPARMLLLNREAPSRRSRGLGMPVRYPEGGGGC